MSVPKNTNALKAPLPPETMAIVLEEALLRGGQRCVFTRFMPGMRLCSEDTVSTVLDEPNAFCWDLRDRWVFDTYVKAAEPGERGKYYRNHEHQCIMANVIDDLYLGYTGGNPDAPVRRIDAATWAANCRRPGGPPPAPVLTRGRAPEIPAQRQPATYPPCAR